LVVLGGIEHELTQRRTVESHDFDVAAVDEHGHPPTLVGRADADVVQLAPVTQGPVPVLSTLSRRRRRPSTLTAAALGTARSRALQADIGVLRSRLRCGRVVL
jgi:hypothetical protein